MLFNSLEFFYFFAIVYALYRVLPFRGQNAMLLVAGYLFYGWWDVRFLFLIAFSTVADFNIGLMLGAGRVPWRQRLLSSAFLVGAAFAFLCLDWPVLARLWQGAGVGRRSELLAPGWTGWITLAGTLVLAAAANLLHDPVARMSHARRNRLLLFVTVFVNLAFLGFFKYFNFFIASAEAALRSIGMDAEMFRLHVILPVGISFYTFQSLSYTIDAYRGLVRPTARFWEFALFVAYFPPMVAGPIERGRHLLPQLQRPRRIRLERSMHGVLLILFGLFKKVAIADGVAPSVNLVFNSSGAVTFVDVAGASVLFAIQIYCDFSGYSDIAIGVSKLLGIELIRNFDLPYFSRNPSEFWRRWHISLSSWLRDYLYIPLGGNRKGNGRTYVNLMATMTLGGLWHGAAFNYVLWGIYQGALLCVHRLFVGGGRTPRVAAAGPLPSSSDAVAGTASRATPSAPARLAWWRHVVPRVRTVLTIGCFLVFMCYGWMLFRATSLGQIVHFTEVLLGFGTDGAVSILPRPMLPAVLGIPLLLVIEVLMYHTGRRDLPRHWPAPVQGAVYAAMIVVLIMGMSSAPAQFIYFQF